MRETLMNLPGFSAFGYCLGHALTTYLRWKWGNK